MYEKIIRLVLLFLGVAMPAKSEQFQVVGAEFPPLMYVKDGNPAGLSVELLQMMLQNLKDVDVKIEFHPVPRMLKIVAAEKNAFTLSITRNQERESQFKWVGPICPRTNALFKLKARSDLQIKILQDLHPYKIGVGRGYAAVNDLLNAGIPKEQIEEVTEDAQNVKKLFMQRIDFVATTDLVFAHVLQQEGHQLNEVEQAMILDAKYQYYYAFHKETDEKIIPQFQQALDQLKQSGEYDALLKKYFK